MSKNKQPVLYIINESAQMQNITGYKKLPNGHIEFNGVLQTIDDINRNTNEYPRDVLSEAINHPRIKELVDRNAWFGEIAHPWDRKNFNRSIDILPSEISHRICQVPYFKGDKLISIIHTVEPCGHTIDSWVCDEGSQLGFSMRGVTPFYYMKDTPVTHKVMKSPMTILTYDTVFYPSHKDALYQTHAGNSATQSYESTFILNEIEEYINTESETYKIFHDELGINLDKNSPVSIATNNGENFFSFTLEDGRLAQINLEESILQEISKAL